MRHTVLTLLVFCNSLLLLGADTTRADKKTVPHFSPGNYRLIEGHESRCRDGEFKLEVTPDVSLIHLGPLHVFSAKDNLKVERSIMDGEEGCLYETDERLRSDKQKTVLTFKTTLSCKGKKRYTLTRTATIKGEEILLEVANVGEDAFSYSCNWKLIED